MELWLAIDQWDGEHLEVAVVVDPNDQVVDLITAIGTQLGLNTDPMLCAYVHRTGRTLDARASIGSSDLRFGDRLSLVPPGSAPPSPAPSIRTGSASLTLTVVGGPAAGGRQAVGLGDHLIGRSPNCEISIDDPTISRRHARLSVREGGATISDAGGTNGIFIEGQRVTEATAVSIGTVIEVGHTLLRIDAFQPGGSRSTTVEHGLVKFNRPPRVSTPRIERAFTLKPPPRTPQSRRIPMLAALGPLLAGLPMVLVGSMQSTGFLVAGLITIVLSPVLAFLSWWEDRRTGNRQFRMELNEFDAQVAELSNRMGASLADEVAERRRRAPDAADLLERAHQHRSNLWERRPTDADFLEASIGWADQPSVATLEFPEDGDSVARARASEVLSAHRVARNVPVVVRLTDGPVGLCGDTDARASLLRWVLLQVSTLHSPREVIMAAAVSEAERQEWAWLSWLPHLHSESSPVTTSHLAAGEREAAALFEALGSVIRSRMAEVPAFGSRRDHAVMPAVVVVISEQLRTPRTTITRLLEGGSEAGVHIVWLGTSSDLLPGECRSIIECTTRPPTLSLTRVTTGDHLSTVVADGVGLAALREMAHALAPVRDVSASGGRGQVPTSVGLLELLDLQEPSAEAVLRRWEVATIGVNAPVGATGAGAFELDMRLDGPHALVGGTTGAGKSELLQTFVAALAATHPPNRVTFLLIDYKGGAAFKDCVDLPHTVGMVTDLDGHLVHRAFVSLNAELRRREHLLRDFGAKDLLEMERRFPDDAPPALVLIVDEFATLAKELPDFVDGVVNVAQRGRSLGIHLILATQRPAGAINDNVRANTNLRIALRMNDQSDSQDVINANDAALLPRTLPGRAFVRTGQSELAEVQIAYVGGHTLARGGDKQEGPEVLRLERGQVVRERRTRAVAVEALTDLQVLVQAIGTASAESGIAAPVKPWLPPLPGLLALDAQTGHHHGSELTIGRVDLPEEQRQGDLAIDLASPVLIIGSSGSGKSTTLRSIAVAACRTWSSDLLHLYVIEGGRRSLEDLRDLPNCGAVIPADQTERVLQLLSRLEQWSTERRALLAERGVPTFDTLHPQDRRVPRVLVLVDDLLALHSALEPLEYGAHVERLQRLIVEANGLGISWAITAERRAGLSAAMLSAAAQRLALGNVDADDLGLLGFDTRAVRSGTAGPGGCWVSPSTVGQIAVVDGCESDLEQARAVHAMAAVLEQPAAGLGPDRIALLPSRVHRAELGAGPPHHALIGLGQARMTGRALDLEHDGLLVAGGSRSGRTTALLTIAQSLLENTAGSAVWWLAPRRRGSFDERFDSLAKVSLAVGPAECEQMTDRLREQIDESAGQVGPHYVIVDDAHELEDTAVEDDLAMLVKRGRDHGVVVIAALDMAAAHRSYASWLADLRRLRRGLLLQPDVDSDGDIFGLRLPRLPKGPFTVGRGYLVDGSSVELVQVAV